MAKPREWWVYDDGVIARIFWSAEEADPKAVHVIEKSPFDERFAEIQADRSRLFDEVKELKAQAFLLADALSNISATGWANGCSNCEECAVCGFGTKYPKDEAKEAYNTWKAYLEKHNGA